MTAPETFTTASKQPLTTGRRPDMKQLFCEGVRFGDLMQRLLGDAAACDRLFQRVVEAAVENANKAGEKQEE